MYEIDATVETCEKVTNEPWVGRITVGSFLCLALAFIFLIGHFSIYAMVCFILVALLSCYCIFQFLKKLTEGVAE
ncbi:hypothetical protein BEI46_17985 [Aliivibrio fischeri]|nr:hypothetical protein BEI46_17985 [Aliivibrio fischeri]